MLDKKNICIRLEAYDHRVLDSSSSAIVSALRRVGAVVGGPIPLPRSIRRVTVLRSPHVDKKSREQFEKRLCYRAIYVSDLTSRGVEVLMDLDIPAGVRVEVKT